MNYELIQAVDCSLPGSSVHGILQARILEWVAISFSRGSSRTRDRTWSPALQEPPVKPEKDIRENQIIISFQHRNANSNPRTQEHCHKVTWSVSFQFCITYFMAIFHFDFCNLKRIFIYSIICCTAQHIGSQFSNQGSRLCSLQ